METPQRISQNHQPSSHARPVYTEEFPAGFLYHTSQKIEKSLQKTKGYSPNCLYYKYETKDQQLGCSSLNPNRRQASTGSSNKAKFLNNSEVIDPSSIYKRENQQIGQSQSSKQNLSICNPVSRRTNLRNCYSSSRNQNHSTSQPGTGLLSIHSHLQSTNQKIRCSSPFESSTLSLKKTSLSTERPDLKPRELSAVALVTAHLSRFPKADTGPSGKQVRDWLMRKNRPDLGLDLSPLAKNRPELETPKGFHQEFLARAPEFSLSWRKLLEKEKEKQQNKTKTTQVLSFRS